MVIGVIGFGSIGRVHATNLTDLGYQVIFYDPQYLGAGSVSSLQALIDKSDAIVIASPCSMHANHAAQCLGKPLFIEKPVWLDFRHPRTYANMVGYNLRHHKCVIAAEDWLTRAGPPLHATAICAQLNDAPKYKDDGLFRNWSHEIDLVSRLLGKPELLGASLTPDETSGTLTLEHPRCLSTVYLDYRCEPQVRTTTIHCQLATITINLAHGYAILSDLNGAQIEKVSVENGFQKSYREEMIAFMQRIHGFTARGATLSEAEDVLSICLKANNLARLT